MSQAYCTTPLGLEVDRVGKHEVEVGAARDDGADEIFRGNPHPALDLLRCFFLLFCITWTEFSPVILA